MDSTDGLVRGMKVFEPALQFRFPFGKGIWTNDEYYREPIDGKGEIKFESKRSIHRDSPEFATLSNNERNVRNRYQVSI
jgi:F0F1-type ATP synthase beta subunit